MLSQTSKYAVHAIMYIAEHDSAPVLRSEIAEALQIPSNYLAKVLNRLTIRGILDSTRGPSGGFTLMRPAHEIALIEVVEAIDENVALDECAFGLPYCGRHTHCKVHARWAKIRQEILSMLNEKIPCVTVIPPPEYVHADEKGRD